ncbi:MAG: hypothetical protein [Wendovervirus sonii]|uniref:Uncharacterized protein n=1 Tax=phage Lak_Megaphage_Sonny TaxID=3109229 RepID=A0ABZ0Z3E1_9CAUD|nr:MAG: hypothetical protein [phage Lak_Megaphage_Sonny]
MEIKRNDQFYNSEIEYISSFSSSLDEYNNIIKKYQDEHPATTENILEYLKIKNKDIKNIPTDEMDKIIRDYNSYVYDQALCLREEYVSTNWKDAYKEELPPDFIWCVCYTEFGKIITSFYDISSNEWGHHKDTNNMTGRTYNNVHYWTPLKFDKLPNVIDGISYINFPEHRHKINKEGLYVHIMPNDICRFTLNHARKYDSYPLRGILSAYSNFTKAQSNEILSIELISIDPDDENNNIIQSNILKEKLSSLEWHIKVVNDETEQQRQKAKQNNENNKFNKLSQSIFEHYDDVKESIVEICRCKNISSEDMDEILNNLETVVFKRQTGKTTRIINDIIDKFYNCPIYTPILIKDHDNITSSMRYLIKLINERLENCNIEYMISRNYADGEWYITRKSETPYEIACVKLEKILTKYNL